MGFPSSLNPEGIISILTSDAQDELVLDYSIESGEEVFEVEIRGKHWGVVTYA
jgi:hypothetical protein